MSFGLVNNEVRAGSAFVQFQLLEHEGNQLIPAWEVKVQSKSSQVIEEVTPRPPDSPDGLIHGAGQVKGRVKEEGQEKQAEQHGRQVLLAVTEVVLEVIALVLEGVEKGTGVLQCNIFLEVRGLRTWAKDCTEDRVLSFAFSRVTLSVWPALFVSNLPVCCRP